MTKTLLSLALAICLLICSPLIVEADDFSNFNVDYTTGWIPLGDWHMGQKSTTFKYASEQIENEFSQYIQGGIALWGNNISVTYSSNGLGTITANFENETGNNATTKNVYAGADKHVGRWTIQINVLDFNSEDNTDEIRVRTIAHELGHVYGLDHVTNPQQLMYHTGSPTKNITNKDIAGIRVMTHEHTHDLGFNYSLEQEGSYTHLKRCTECYAYERENCSHTSYHSANKHYFIFNCNCGNNETLSWDCSGNPCIMPFSVTPEYEIE